MQVLTKRHLEMHKKNIRLRTITHISKPKQNILSPSQRALADIHNIKNETDGSDWRMHKAIQMQNYGKLN